MLELELEEHPSGIVLPLKVQAGAKKNGIQGVHAGVLKVSVTTAPEKGKANQAIIKLLAKQLHLAKSNFEMIRGATSSQKKLLIRQESRKNLLEKIQHLLGAG